MRTIATLCLMLCSYLVYSQHDCGFDHYHSYKLSLPEYEDAETELNYRAAEYILNHQGFEREDELVVPVVVHIIHQNGDENISDAQVEMAIEQLNHGFANTGPYFLPTGIDTHIRFCLAGTDPDGNFTTGINRVQNNLTEMFVPSEDAALKDVIRWDTEKYMNIWVVKEIIREPNSPGVIGYATFPTEHGSNTDGIVCEAAYFGVDDNVSKVHIHEAGHYLGLYHTFQNGCPNSNCLLDGDRVCDTPPDNVTFSVFCYNGTNSCATDEDDLSLNNPFRPVVNGGIGDQVDKQDNFMDYSNLSCFKDFTQGQSDRMAAVLEVARQSLLEGNRCVTPCESPFEAQINASSTSTIVGSPIPFSADIPSDVEVSWLVDDVLAGTGASFNFSAAVEGQFELVALLSNADIGCDQEFLFLIDVICPISAVFPFESNSYPPNTTLTFEGVTEGITSHTWTVNGVTVGTSSTLNYTFSNDGVNVVTHNVENGLCTDSYTVSVLIGTCFSGREANLMYWNNNSGQAYGFDFNQSGIFNLIYQAPPQFTNNAHNRATYCNAYGELVYYADGDVLYDKDFNLLQNGDVIASPTAYQGSLFIAVPGSEDLVYYFSSAANPWSDGLRYSIIDKTMNNGLGAVTDVKDVFIEVTGSEGYRSIQHCNMVDFWIVYYDGIQNEFHAHLVNSEGVSTDPVVSEINLSNLLAVTTAPLIVNDEGSKLFLRGAIMDFNQSTGEVELVLDSVFDELVIAYCFSSSSRYAYFVAGDLDVSFYRIDLSLPTDEWLNNIELIYELTIDYFGVGMMAAPDGKIYYESTSGWLSAVLNPEAELSELEFVLNYQFTGTLINTFPNYHHAYFTGATLYPEGDAEICTGETHTYSVGQSECLTQEIVWEIDGVGELTEVSNGIVNFTSEEPGEAKLIVSIELACGLVSDTLFVSVQPGIEIDLGPDIGFCSGQTLTLSPGPGYDVYAWQDGSSSTTYQANIPGTYSVEVSLNGCHATDDIVVGPVFSGNINLGPDVFLCDGETVILDAGPNFANYIWQDGSLGQFFTAYEAGMVYVTATSPCLASDTLIVTDCDQSINHVNELNEFGDYLYPNPVRNELNINLATNAMKMEVFDATGRLVYSCGYSKVGLNVISLSSIQSGAYVLVVDGEHHRSMRFVKTD